MTGFHAGGAALLRRAIEEEYAIKEEQLRLQLENMDGDDARAEFSLMLKSLEKEKKKRISEITKLIF